MPAAVANEAAALVGLLAVGQLAQASRFPEVEQHAKALVAAATHANRRTLDTFVARLHQYYALALERQGRIMELYAPVLAAYRTSCLQRSAVLQATLLNILLRCLLHMRDIDGAAKLISRTVFPETASHNQLCRYMYYCGVVSAYQLDYPEATRFLQQAIRKAPQNTGIGFRITVRGVPRRCAPHR